MAMVTIDSITIQPGLQRLDSPVVTARGNHAERRYWWVRVRDTSGREGVGEAAPWPGFGPEMSDLGISASVLERALGERIFDSPSAIDSALGPLALAGPARHAVEQAILDLLAQTNNVELGTLLSNETRSAVRVHRLVENAEQAQTALALGIETFKVKGGRGLDEDDARLEAIRASAPEASIRLDANGAWTREEAAACFDRLSRHGLEWIEQPLTAEDISGLSWLRERFPVPIAADESMVHDSDAVLDTEAADVVVVKPMFLGGILRGWSLAQRARKLGFGVCVTHALESSVGRWGALQLAASLGGDDAHGVAPADENAILDGQVSAIRRSIQ